MTTQTKPLYAQWNESREQYVLNQQEQKIANHMKKRILEAFEQDPYVECYQLRYKCSDLDGCSILALEKYFENKEEVYPTFEKEKDTYLVSIRHHKSPLEGLVKLFINNLGYKEFSKN